MVQDVAHIDDIKRLLVRETEVLRIGLEGGDLNIMPLAQVLGEVQHLSREVAGGDSRAPEGKIDTRLPKAASDIQQLPAMQDPEGTRDISHLRSSDGFIRLWSRTTHELVARLSTDMSSSAGILFFNTDGSRVVTNGTRSHVAHIWDVYSFRKIQTIFGRPTGYRVVAASADTQRMIASGPHKTVQIWDTATRQPIDSSWELPSPVNDLAFSPDGKRVVVACEDSTARVWDAETGKPIGPPFLHEGPVNSVAFDPHGTRVLTASEDKTARVWRADFPTLHGPLEQILLWINTITGMEIDSTGMVRILDAASWRQRRDQLYALGGPPIP